MYYFFPKLPTVFDISYWKFCFYLMELFLISFILFLFPVEDGYYTYFRNMLFASERYWGKFVFFDT